MRFLFILLVSCFYYQTIFAQKATGSPLRKYAIVIGNAEYTKLAPLTAPANDAEEVANILRDDCGFIVDKYQNIKQVNFQKWLDNWSKTAEKYDVVLFYFSGHGVFKQGQQYLLAIDADTSLVNIAENRNLNDIKAKLNPNGKNKTILVVDACRSNSLVIKQKVVEQIDKGGKGSSSYIDPPFPNEFLETKTFFASSANKGSEDGNVFSRYTEVLIEHLRKYADKQTVSPFFAAVKAALVKKGDYPQFPNAEGDVSEEFYLKEPIKKEEIDTDQIPIKKCKEWQSCSLCEGTGMKETFSICKTCNGTGTGLCIGCQGRKVVDKRWVCVNCDGTPKICVTCQGKKRISSFIECPDCHGQGQIEQEVDCK